MFIVLKIFQKVNRSKENRAFAPRGTKAKHKGISVYL